MCLKIRSAASGWRLGIFSPPSWSRVTAPVWMRGPPSPSGYKRELVDSFFPLIELRGRFGVCTRPAVHLFSWSGAIPAEMHKKTATLLLDKFDVPDLERRAYRFDGAAPGDGPFELEIAEC